MRFIAEPAACAKLRRGRRGGELWDYAVLVTSLEFEAKIATVGQLYRDRGTARSTRYGNSQDSAVGVIG
jgi:hypothetical protein